MEKSAFDHLESSHVLERNTDIFTADVDEEMVMMDGDQGLYFSLNPVARKIWEILEKPLSYAELITSLQAAYDVDAARCRADVEPFLRKMLENGLVRVRP